MPKKAPVNKPPRKPAKPATKKTVKKTVRSKRKHKSTTTQKLGSIFGKLQYFIPNRRWAVILLLVIGFVVLWLKGLPQQYFYEYTADQGLLVKNITISGQQFANPDEVRAALNITQGEPMARFDPQVAHDNLINVRWVEGARVQRKWPDTIVVNLKERRPIAIVTSDKRKDHLVDRKGKSLGPVTRQFKNLITLKGTGAGDHALTLLAILESHPTLEEKLKLAERIGNRRWNLYFLGDLEVRLPEDTPQKAWDRLAQVARRRPIFDGSIARIDLRIPDRMVVKPSKNDSR